MEQRPPPSRQAVEQLVTHALELEIEELLDLCFAFQKDPRRLTVYIDVFRRKGGMRANAAACLVCFDLARAGFGRFESEFIALLPVVERFLSEDRQSFVQLLGNDDYLNKLFLDLERRLSARDRRDIPDEVTFEQEVVDLDLFGEDDILDIGLDDLIEEASDNEQMNKRWRDQLDAFFVIELALAALQGQGTSQLATGFSANKGSDLERVENLRNEALSYHDFVKHAGDMLPIIEMFRASHMRSTNLFGRPNQARLVSVQDGLSAFATLKSPPEDVVSWLSAPTAVPYAWDKVAELLLDFIAHLGSLEPGSLSDAADINEAIALSYIQARRPQPPPDRLNIKPGARRR